MGREISAIGIKKIYYGPVIDKVEVPYDETNVDNATGLSPKELKAWMATAKQVKNVHQDTWNFEEGEPTKTTYKNQLTKKVYRSKTEPGDVAIKFSIGKMDFEVKKDFKGGVATEDKYSVPSTYQDKYMTIVGLTEDDVYIILSKANVSANDVTTDDAIAMAVTATPEEPDIQIESIAWIRKESVDKVITNESYSIPTSTTKKQ